MMLKFCRNKLVNVVKKDAGSLNVHGFLDDDIYSLEIDVTIQISDLSISSIAGKWHRHTTPDCPRAIPILQEAIGLRIDDEGFNLAVQKIIGRKACRHYANLLIECCDSAQEAARLIKWMDAQETNAYLSFEEFIADGGTESSLSAGHHPIRVEQERVPPGKEPTERQISNHQTAKKSADGFTVDLHIHTYPASPCSSAPEDQLIHEAKRIGLDAICFTDHNYVWDAARIEALSQKHEFLIFRGTEITTDQGDMLVFGYHEDITGIIPIELLGKEVVEADGFIIAAHPFRGFLTFDAAHLGLTPEKAMQRPLFKLIHALEVLNGKVTPKENDFARQVANGLGIPTTGGSDAHDVFEVGQYATRFFMPLKNEKDLLQALKSGNYEAIAYRTEKGFD
jgi:predicted metal-dependent phosphoesterase TrpH